MTIDLQAADAGAKLLSFFPALERLGAPFFRKEIPFTQQTMATDCGAACLTMILGYHGKHVGLEDVRSVLQVTRDGVTARAIVEAANNFALDARGVKVGIDDLEHLPQGSILHWEFVHFVVFDRLAKNGDVHIVDPATGPRRVKRAEAETAVTGIAIVLEPRETFEKGKRGESVVLRYLRSALRGSQDWGRIAMMSLTIEGLTVMLPLITGRLIDRVIPRHDIHLLMVLVAAFAVSAVFYLIASLVRGHLLLHLRTKFDARMTMAFVQHILRLPYEFFELRQPADLQMRVSSIQSIREVLTGAVLSAALDGTLVVAHLFFLATMSLRMLGIALAVVAIQGLLYFATRRRIRELSADVIAKQTNASNALNEILNGIESLKAGGVEQRAAQGWAANYVDVLNIGLRRGATQATSESVLNVLKVGGPVLLLIVGIMDVMGGRMSLGTMLSANAMAVGFITPTMSLIQTLLQLQQVQAQLMRVEDVVNTPVEQGEGRRMRAPRLSGHITLDRVSFRYGPKLPLAVRDVSLEIKPGEMVAIVGRSGSGKSTLGRLLVGLYQPGEGGIQFDGLALAQLDLQSLRQQLGVVVQRAHVFGNTVRANIALGQPEIPLERVMQAAQLARIHQDIAAMPMGYDTMIMAGGSSLSGGQRQRIALARAIVNAPSILLLDEATSALDTVTERAVTEQLDTLRCTRIVIAHRLSTIVNADRILVMEKGQIVEMGTHTQLLAKGGLYAKLAALQVEASAPAGAQAPAEGPMPAVPPPAAMQAQMQAMQAQAMQAQAMQAQAMQAAAMQAAAMQAAAMQAAAMHAQATMAPRAAMPQAPAAPPPLPSHRRVTDAPSRPEAMPPRPQHAPPPLPSHRRNVAAAGHPRRETGPVQPAAQLPAAVAGPNVRSLDEMRTRKHKAKEIDPNALAKAVGAGTPGWGPELAWGEAEAAYQARLYQGRGVADELPTRADLERRGHRAPPGPQGAEYYPQHATYEEYAAQYDGYPHEPSHEQVRDPSRRRR